MTAVPHGAEIRLGVESGEDLTGEQFKFVKKNSSGKLVKIAAATDKPFGVLQDNDVVSGRIGEVVILGPTYLSANGQISEDDLVGPSADGQADPKVPGTDTTEYVAGRALEAATAASQQIIAVVNCITPHRAA
ncbi:MAG: DUF2190 family protein [Anaerolineae bacterium]|nr:DUF2190 family protein [Anaerolineae bacterium]